MAEAETATTSTPQTQETPRAFLDTPAGENAFFKAVARARPVGVHKHNHMLSIRMRIQRETGVMVPDADIWDKLNTLYDLAALEQYEGGSWPRVDVSPAPTPISHPTETDNLRTHGFFQKEFSLVDFEDIWPLCLARAPATSPSPSDGPPSPAETTTSARGKAPARGKTQRGRGGRTPSRGRGGRGRGRGAPAKGGGDSTSDLTSEDDDKSGADDPGESRAGSTVQSGTPMDEDGDTDQSEEEDEDDAPATRRARGPKKRPAKKAPGPTPAKKKRKSNAR